MTLHDVDRSLAQALRPLKQARLGDFEKLDRLIDRALDAPPPPPAAHAWAVPGSIAGVFGAAAVVFALLSPRTTDLPPSAAPPPAIATTAEAPAPATTDDIPTVSIDTLPSPTASALLLPPKAPSAAELFSRANEERRKGASSAVADYRLLQSTYPDSSEAKASFVALGRLLLDKGSDYPGALAQFDRYLSTMTAGPLSEEALIGRALALQHLGRTSEEEKAWHAVLEKYPDSIYAGEARARLDAL